MSLMCVVTCMCSYTCMNLCSCMREPQGDVGCLPQSLHLFYACVWASVSLYAPRMYRSPWRPEEDVGFPGSGVRWFCAAI